MLISRGCGESRVPLPYRGTEKDRPLFLCAGAAFVRGDGLKTGAVRKNWDMGNRNRGCQDGRGWEENEPQA